LLLHQEVAVEIDAIGRYSNVGLRLGTHSGVHAAEHR
jgi:hypothetical protein